MILVNSKKLLMDVYYFKYNTNSEFPSEKNHRHKRFKRHLVVEDINLDKAFQRAEDHIKNRKKFTGDIEDYDLRIQSCAALKLERDD
jgi:hypothetical protein